MKKTLLIFSAIIFLSLIRANSNLLTYDSQIPDIYYNISKHYVFENSLDFINDPFFDTDFDSLTIPIKRAGNLILIETVIDGQRGNLIFDSGAASELVLNKTYFRDYRKKGSKTVSGVNGNIQNVDIIGIDSMFFAEMILRDKFAESVDLSKIENRIKSKVLGFFGLQMIDEFEFVIDLENNILQLFSLDKKGRRSNSDRDITSYDYTQKIEIINSVVFIWAEIAGKDLRFCFDTAAEKNMISHTVSKKVIQTISITGRAKLTGAGSQQKEVLIGEMNDFVIGDHRLKNMEALIADISALDIIYNTYVSGVLGFDFVKKGKIIVNIPKRQFNINFYQ